MKQTRDSKLSAIYEPDPYVVAHKDENAFTLQDVKGNCKMRNMPYMNILVEPATIEIDIKWTSTAGVSRASSGTSAVRPARNYGQPAVGTVTGSPPEQLPRQFRYISASEHKAYACIDDKFCLQLVHLKKQRETVKK